MSAILELPISPSTNTHAVTARPLTIAIAGNPNAGKTSLFNALTGLRQKVANYPGVTVESKIGEWTLSPDSVPARLVDLPGLYSLDATSLDEEIARDILLNRKQVTDNIDTIVVVVDATNLVRNLYLATQLIDTGRPVVIALTMFDLAERDDLKIDVAKLGAELGVPVVPVVAKQRRGLIELANAVLAAKHAFPLQTGAENTRNDSRHRQSNLIRRYARIERIVSEATEAKQRQKSTSEKIDRFVTHRLLGPLILVLVLLVVFQSIFSWATLPMSLIENVFGALGNFVRLNTPAGLFTDLLVDGVIAGVGGVLVFLPQILLLFFFIAVLEDSGYMARAAFLMDRLMRSVGLHGKAFMPLLSSFACAVPGIMATRTIENPKDRIATIMIAPFMSCSARLPVYTLMIAALFAGQTVLGFISTGALIILGMYLLGIVAAIVVASLLRRTVLKAPTPPFVMEMPPYRVPSVRNVARAMLMRATIFLKRAGTVILAVSILLWALAAFPRAKTNNAKDSQSTQLEQSFVGRAGHVIEPLIKPLGFDWKIGIGLISSFAARETIISTLSVVYNAGDDSESQSLVGAMRNAKHADGAPVWTPLVGLSLMVFFVLACQCMSTVAIVRRETNSWRWPLFMVGYMMVLAYVASLITFQGGRLLGFS
ncbi:MAG TPA: ferrous iron transport protein B [Pyrinomonadaceae bacterium]|nr:ferrous iron transport protein B [Pyrinomonadaceae bacterium]